jgi:Ubiquitin carboxyl-terminal hydrolase
MDLLLSQPQQQPQWQQSQQKQSQRQRSQQQPHGPHSCNNNNNHNNNSPPIIHGLSNPTGTTCYINTSLLVLCYTLQPIVLAYFSILIEQQEEEEEQQQQQGEGRTPSAALDIVKDEEKVHHNNNNSLNQYRHLPRRQQQQQRREFINVLCQILVLQQCDEDSTHDSYPPTQQQQRQHYFRKAIDPTKFYQSFQRHTSPKHQSSSQRSQSTHPQSTCVLSSIQYDTYGDAVSTLIRLLQYVLESVSLSYNTSNNTDLHHDNSNKDEENRTVQETGETSSVGIVFPSSTQRMQHTFQTMLYSGRVYSVLYTTTEHDHNNQQKFKVLKQRSLFNPLPVPIRRNCNNSNHNNHRHHTSHSPSGAAAAAAVVVVTTDTNIFTSLQDAMYDLFCTEHIVNGYQWNKPTTATTNANDTVASERNTKWEDEGENDLLTTTATTTAPTITTRRLQVVSFPPIFMIHLQRFTMKSSSKYVQPIEDVTSHIQIPDILNVSDYYETLQQPNPANVQNVDHVEYHDDDDIHHRNDDMYHLVGGIVHIHDYDGEDPRSDDHPCNYDAEVESIIPQNIGHYVTVVKRRRRQQQCPEQSDEDQWYVIDDETVTPVSSQQVLLWLGGGWYECSDCSDCNTKCETVLHNDGRPDNENGGSSSHLFARGVLLMYHRTDLVVSDTNLTDVASSMTKWMAHEATTLKSSLSELHQHFPSIPVLTDLPGVRSPTDLGVKHSYWFDYDTDTSDDDE